MMLVISAKSTVEPVTLEELKLHLRISTAFTGDDSVLTNYIVAARTEAEKLTRRELSTATRVLYLDDFPDDTAAIEIPRPPLSTTASDISVKYINTTGVEATVSSTVYTIDYDSEPGKIYCQYEEEWPDCRDQRKAVYITYKCGYSASVVPEPIKVWIKMRAGAMYEHREPIVRAEDGGQFWNMNRNYFDGLLDDFRVPVMST